MADAPTLQECGCLVAEDNESWQHSCELNPRLHRACVFIGREHMEFILKYGLSFDDDFELQDMFEDRLRMGWYIVFCNPRLPYCPPGVEAYRFGLAIAEEVGGELKVTLEEV